MSLSSRLYKAFESWVVRNKTGISGKASHDFSGLNSSEFSELLTEIHTVSKDREDRLRDYEEMLTDGITLSAAELIAEDANQMDDDQQHIIWVTSTDEDFQNRMNTFLHDKVEIDKMAFAIGMNIVVYGEAFLNTFKSDDTYAGYGFTVGDYFELEHPRHVAHIYHYGKSAGYYVSDENKYSSSLIQNKILSENDFIHFISDRGLNREKISVRTINDAGEEAEDVYTVRYGSSFLEAARTYFRTRVLLDNILILSRLSRSQFYRLFSIEVGNADSIETEEIVKEIRDAISTQRSFDLNGRGLNTIASPMSTGGNIYIPVREGKGSTNVVTTGGDVDVRAILDIDYFDNQYYGALKVPKQFLGQSEDMPGGLGDTTLTRLDIRYARTCKRLQSAEKEGVRDLIYWYCSEKSLPIKDFEVHMAKITTADDDEKAQYIEAQVNKVNTLLDMVDRFASASDEEGKLTLADTRELLKYIIESIYGDHKLSEVMFGKEETKNEPGPVFEGRETV